MLIRTLVPGGDDSIDGHPLSLKHQHRRRLAHAAEEHGDEQRDDARRQHKWQIGAMHCHVISKDFHRVDDETHFAVVPNSSVMHW